MSEKCKNRDGRTIHQDYQGYYVLDNVGRRIKTDIHGEPIQEFNFPKNIERSNSALDYKGKNIFVKILMFALKVLISFIKVIVKLAGNMTFGR